MMYRGLSSRDVGVRRGIRELLWNEREIDDHRSSRNWRGIMSDFNALARRSEDWRTHISPESHSNAFRFETAADLTARSLGTHF